MGQFTRAQRRQAKARVGIIGPSGSGKTYSALLLAKGMGKRIAVIDTERHSAELYADLAEYDVLCLEDSFHPKNYISAIDAAAQAGYDVLIIDSLSHAWAGTGGVLDIVDRAAGNSNGNKFAAWRTGTPEHNRLVDAILGAPLHVIATLRAKTEWVLEDDARGKKVPVKKGVGAVQRDGMEYEFTLVFELDQQHVASASKDRTSLFDDFRDRLSEKVGTKLRTWLEGGTPPTPKTTTAQAAAMVRKVHESEAVPAEPLSPEHEAEMRSEIRRLIMAMCDVKAGAKPTAAQIKCLKERCKEYSGYERPDDIHPADLREAFDKTRAEFGVWKMALPTEMTETQGAHNVNS